MGATGASHVASTNVEQSLIDAAGVLLGRWGYAKTNAADLAKVAGCSRATLYRAFPGGKRQIMGAYALCELRAFFAAATASAAEAEDLSDALSTVISIAAVGLEEHAGFQFMLEHEPGLVLPYLGFSNVDRLYRLVTDALAPSFERFVGTDAPRLVEMATRITLSYVFQPSESIDLCRAEDVRRLVDRHLIPTVPDNLAVTA